MPDAMKIRAQLQGDTADIRVLMSHPMETGQRKDAKNQPIPAHYIQTFTATVNGKPVVEAQLNTSVSRNPVFGFKVKGVKAGDKVVITWVDNKGENRSDEATIG